MDGSDERPALWPDRHLTHGRLLIARGAELAGRQSRVDRFLHRSTTWYRSLQTRQRIGAAVVLAGCAGAPFWRISPIVAGGMALATLLAAGVLLLTRPQPQRAEPRFTEATLAAGDTTEARVAAAATRAWRETVAEPAWGSPHLSRSRSAFDGQAEVDHVIDVALDIFTARVRLGVRPQGPAAEYWERQQHALEATAVRLGERADALIRYRDQAARLSADLRQLSVLEDLEAGAFEIEDLASRTTPPRGDDGGLRSVADEIAGVRAAMSELVDLMTQTLAALHEPVASPAGSARPGDRGLDVLGG